MHRQLISTLGAAAVVLLTGCAARGANYERPQVPTPKQYRFVETTDRAESLADLRWWQVFDDSVLHALIREALSNNLDVHAAVARVERARAQVGIARSFLYPQVDGAANYTARQNVGGSESENGVQQSAVYGFQLSWEIDVFGRLRREREAAFALFLSTEQARRGVLVTLVGD